MLNSESKSISTCTVWRELKGFGLNSYLALRKPLFSEANQNKRLQFDREHIDWTLEQCKKVMWSDESRFTLFQSDGHIRVRREVEEVRHPSCLVPTVQACGGSAMIWGCCSWSGLGSAMLCAQMWRRFCAAVRLSHHQYKILAKTLMQLWTGIHVVTLQKLIETMPLRMHAVIKDKGGQTNY